MSLSSYTIEIASSAHALDPKTKRQRVHLFTHGAMNARDGRVFFLDDAKHVVDATLKAMNRRDIPVDYEHQTDLARFNGKPAPAAGWIKEIESDDDGIWALVEWTDIAARMIEQKQYRYISPTFRADKDGVVQRIERAALTNNPALELTQLASQQSYDTAEISEDEEAFRSELSQVLGLEPQADRQSIIEALKALIAQQDDQSSDDVEAMASMMQDVAEERLKVKMARVRDKVANAISSGVMPPAMRSWMIRLCSQNEDAFDEMLVKVGTPFSYLAEEQITDSMIQMATSGETSALNQSLDEEVAAQLGIDPASMT